MKILAICLLKIDDRGKASVLLSSSDLSSINYFKRSNYEEFCKFLACTFAERVPKNSRHSLHEQDATGHLYTNSDGISAVIICDNEYPTRVAFDLIAKILKKYSESNYSDKTQEYLDEVIIKYQQPENIDSIMRVQRDLEETKVVLHETIGSLLERGEKIDELVSKSDQLGNQSKLFFKHAKKTNSCCIIQ